MTSERDIERKLDRWFADRPTVVADRVLDEVADRIGRQPQQPAWRVSWRDSHVNTYFKPLLAVAAIVVFAAAGFVILRPPNPSVGGPSAPVPSPSANPTAAPTVSPTAVPSTSAVFPAWFPEQSDGSGILPAGSQTTRQFLAGSTLTVPEGWVNDADNAQIYTLFPNTPANEDEYAVAKATAQNIVIAATVANNMFAICDATGLFQGATAADVVDGVVANDALSTTEPVDVTIGGLSGRQVDIQLDPGWTGGCRLRESDPATKDYRDARNRLIVLDAPGRGPIGIIIGSSHASDFQAFLADAMPIVSSLEFRLEP